MMKYLYILRHGKAIAQESSIDDHSRPLTPRGIRDSHRAGTFIKNNYILPDLIISSTASRAKMTAENTAHSCGYQGTIELKRTLYLCSANTYLKTLQKISDNIHCVLLVGHNPGMEKLVKTLAGHYEEFPTAALATFELSIHHWSEVLTKKPVNLHALWRPKEHAR